MKLTKAEIRWDKNFKYWKCEIGWDKAFVYTNIGTMAGITKSAFIRRVVRVLKAYISNAGMAFSLRIYKKNGQLQEERTYPRSRDPKKSKG